MASKTSTRSFAVLNFISIPDGLGGYTDYHPSDDPTTPTIVTNVPAADVAWLVETGAIAPVEGGEG